MANIITAPSQIPESNFYVTATDKHSSARFQAQGLSNRVVFPCLSIQEVKKMVRALESHPEFSNVRVGQGRPRLRRGNVYSVFDKGPNLFCGFYGRRF